MANISYDLDGLEDMLTELAMMPDHVKRTMVEAGGKVVSDEIAKSAGSMLHGPYSKGHTRSHVVRKTPKVYADGASQTITFDGTIHDEKHRKGTKAATIAFVNEYGKRGQPARPFIQTAVSQSDDKAVDAMQKVFDDYIESKIK